MSRPQQFERLFSLNRFLKTRDSETNAPLRRTTEDGWTNAQLESQFERELHMDFMGWEHEQAQRLAIDQHYTQAIDHVRKLSMPNIYEHPYSPSHSPSGPSNMRGHSSRYPLQQPPTYSDPWYTCTPHHHAANPPHPPGDYEQNGFSTFAIPGYEPRRSSASSSQYTSERRRSQDSHNTEPNMRRTGVGRDQYGNQFAVDEPTEDEESRGRKSRLLQITGW